MSVSSKKNSLSLRNSKYWRLILFIVGSLVLLLLFVGVILLTNNFLFKPPSTSLSRIEYYGILGVILLMFTGVFIIVTWLFIIQISELIKANHLENSDPPSEAGGDDLVFQQKSITALLSISESRGNLLPLDQVFHHALRVVQEVTGFNTVVIRLYDEKIQGLKIAAQQGMSLSMQRELAVVSVNNPIAGEALRSFWPVPVEDLAIEDTSFVGASSVSSGFRSVICIPLVSGDVPVGTMDLGAKEPHQWTQDELRWLALVGRTIGSIVHRVRLTEHLRDFAALQERSRLAQELHDGLVQLVGSINMWSKEAKDAISEQDYLATQDAISRIETFSSDAYASLREELLGLRDTFDSDRDFLSVIREYLSRFQRQWGIDTQLKIDESNDKISQLISPAAEIQLLRVIQEALTNVRRHAEATKVMMTIVSDEENLKIQIEDNGQGFVFSEVQGDHLGLSIMRERITSVGGNINVESEPGSGTRIHIEVPRQEIKIIHGKVL